MIYTVTFNPSLDYIVDVTDFKTGVVNRTTGEKIFAGGKGINVSMVLKNLGMSNTSLGFTAGFTGNEIKRLLAKKGVDTDFIEVNFPIFFTNFWPQMRNPRLMVRVLQSLRTILKNSMRSLTA